MTNQIKIEQNADNPAARYFILSSLPQTISTPLRLRSKEAAQEAGCPIAVNFLGTSFFKTQEIRLYPHDGHDVLCIIMQSADEWDKKLDTRRARPLEESIREIIEKQIVLAANPLVKVGNGIASLAEMDSYLQKNKPDTVDRDNGSVRVAEFDAKRGVLKIEFGKTCASGCVAGQQGTRVTVTALMRNRFPEVRDVKFTADLT